LSPPIDLTIHPSDAAFRMKKNLQINLIMISFGLTNITYTISTSYKINGDNFRNNAFNKFLIKSYLNIVYYCLQMRQKNNDNKVSNYSKRKHNATHSQKAKLGTSIIHKHDEKMDFFSNKDKQIKEYNKEIELLRKDLERFEIEKAVCEANNKFSTSNSTEIYKKIQDIEKVRDDLASGKSENEYILSVFMLINEFSELEEEEKFCFQNQDDSSLEQKLFEINVKKRAITDDYLKIIDPTYSPSRQHLYTSLGTRCANCNNCLVQDSGFAVCYECGSTFNCVHEATELSYKEAQEFDYRSQFTYDKRTHLLDWLRRFQAKENKDIPQDILDKVILEAKKERITDLNVLDEKKVKSYLKKLNLNDYYDNVISIINRINKRQPFTLTQEIEDKIMEMFQQIQEPFEKYKEKSRKNMLSYSFLLNKFFLILGLPEFSKYFFLLKSPEKLRQQDETFKKIVDHMAKIDHKTQWQFYPSL
jgi:hypothetical protein